MFEAIDDISRTELVSRETNGITVRLLWSRSTNLVTVAVDDAANDDYFELILDEHKQALDVFHHPLCARCDQGARVPHWSAGVGGTARCGVASTRSSASPAASSLRNPCVAQRRFVATTAETLARRSRSSLPAARAKSAERRRRTRSRARSPIANPQPDVMSSVSNVIDLPVRHVEHERGVLDGEQTPMTLITSVTQVPATAYMTAGEELVEDVHAGRRSVPIDRGAGRPDRVPRGAERRRALAGRLAGLRVREVRVERVALVGDLKLPVLPLGRPEQRGLGGCAGLGRALGQQRRPVLRAGARAGALAALAAPSVGAVRCETT